MKRVRIKWKALEAAARTRRPGFLDAVQAAGRMDGEWLLLDERAHAALVAQWEGALTGHRGLGDWVAEAAKPVARVYDAVADRVTGQPGRHHLADCEPCARRQKWLNGNAERPKNE
jgi:hypothetical protein